MDESVPMNRLFMSATLGRRDGKPPSSLEVVGYSEVGKAQEGAESQKGVSLQTGGNVQRTLLNMFFTTQDIIETLYDEPCAEKLAQDPSHSCGKQTGKKFSNLVKARFRLYLPEITAISDFFLASDTAQVAGILGSEAFDIDPPSLQAIMKTYKENISILFDQSANSDKQNEALEDLVERTKLFWHDFKYIDDEIKGEAYRLYKSILNEADEYVSGDVTCFEEEDFEDVKNRYELARKTIWKSNRRNRKHRNDNTLDSIEALEVDAVQCYTMKWNRDIANQLKKYFVPGQIFLSTNDVKSGDTVMLRIEAKESLAHLLAFLLSFSLRLEIEGRELRSRHHCFL